jgi:hypothetical protein
MLLSRKLTELLRYLVLGPVAVGSGYVAEVRKLTELLRNPVPGPVAYFDSYAVEVQVLLRHGVF